MSTIATIQRTPSPCQPSPSPRDDWQPGHSALYTALMRHINRAKTLASAVKGKDDSAEVGPVATRCD